MHIQPNEFMGSAYSATWDIPRRYFYCLSFGGNILLCYPYSRTKNFSAQNYLFLFTKNAAAKILTKNTLAPQIWQNVFDQLCRNAATQRLPLTYPIQDAKINDLLIVILFLIFFLLFDSPQGNIDGG
jgi:hypothetical protein